MMLGNMRDLIKVLFVLLMLPLVGYAQSDTAMPKIGSMEAGVEYGVDVPVGVQEDVARHRVALHYATYTYNNLGFRTGLSYIFSSPIAGSGVAVPLHFSWCSGRMARSEYSQGHYYNGVYYPDTTPVADSVGWYLLSEVTPKPSYLELHAGITPSWQWGEYITNGVENFGRGLAVTADIGAKLMWPIGNCRLYADVTYHHYLPTPTVKRVMHASNSRSVVSIGVGLSYCF